MQRLISDTQIRANVRSILTQQHLDIQPLAIASARGVIRVTGELRRSTSGAGAIRPSTLDDLERELRRVQGVRRVYIEAPNWRRSTNGTWVPVKPAATAS